MKVTKKQQGSFHIIVLVSMALIVIVTGFIGLKAYQKETEAAGLNARQCRSLGRAYDNKCLKKCQTKAGTFREGTRWGYCSAAAEAITPQKCNALHRVFVRDKCLKAWVRNFRKAPIAPCQDGYFSYIPAKPHGKCSANKKAKGALPGNWS